MISIQTKMWLDRAGLLNESKSMEDKIQEFLHYLEHEAPEEEDEEHPDNIPWEDDEKSEHDKKMYEHVVKTETTPKEKQYTSNDKGVLHELLVGHHLLGKHMSKHPDKEGDTPKQAHDKIKAALHKKHGNHDEYNRLNTKAKSAAADIKKHIEKSGHKIHDVHWTSKPGDIKRSTGIHASQKEDASDIVVHAHHPKTPKKTKYIGASLKVTDGTNKHITASNPGMESTHGAHDIVKKHREELLKAHPKLIGVKSSAKRKEIMKNDPKMKEDVTKRNHEVITKIAKHISTKLTKAPKEDLVHHIRTHVLQANKTPLQHNGHEHIRHTTYQTGKKEGNKTVHETINPSEHWNHILNDHKNITVQHSGGNVHFLHKGNKFATHRMRVSSSSDPLPSFKGDGKAHGD
jgi:hypothetical protein